MIHRGPFFVHVPRGSPLLDGPWSTLLLAIMLLSSCSDPFQYHPWEVEVPTDLQDLNVTAMIATSERLSGASQQFSFAILSDPQLHYDELQELLDAVECQQDLAFVVVNGDLSDQGLQQEFLWYMDIIGGHSTPVISIIGNHDHLGNGRHVFESMFGPRNTLFHAGGVRFILFDNVEFESEVEVDHAWLDSELARPFAGHTLVFMHVNPGDVQLQGAPLASLEAIMETRRPTAVFMGHLHTYATGIFPGGTPWTVVPWPRRRSYLRVDVRSDSVAQQLVELP